MRIINPIKSISLGLLVCLVFCGVTNLAASAKPALEFRGYFTQGGLVIGKTEPSNNVTLNSKSLVVDANGYFTMGFGRDEKLNHRLTIVSKNSTAKLEHPFKITKRTYKVERVDGLPPSKVNPYKPETLKRIRAETKLVKSARATFSYRNDFVKEMIWPAVGRISGVYGSQRVLNGEPKRPHYGLDIANKKGANVKAPWSGKVVLTHPDMYFSGGTIVLEHGLGVTTSYIHLSRIDVKPGDIVEQGQVIGGIGSTGRATGPHLDWRMNWYNTRLDPHLFVEELPQP
jgi:murein DD-endopeptidase MepM/ murein hydrolase activator NlpD